MNNSIGQIAAIFLGLITVAIVAVLVGKNSQTGSLITAFTGGFAKDLQAATLQGGGSTGSIGIPALNG